MIRTAPGHLLGGRVRHDQPLQGHRTGIEPVLLAAAIPARPGQCVLEGGSGAGAALLCLAHRVPGVRGLGIERDPGLTETARANAAANGFAGLAFRADDVAAADETVDHAFANPPWHDARGTPSPDPQQEAARRADTGLARRWAAALARGLRSGGTLTVSIAAHALPCWLHATDAAGCGSAVVLPLWPRPDRAARLVLLQAVRGGRAPFALLPGLVLHERDGGFTAAADAILRDGAALDLRR